MKKKLTLGLALVSSSIPFSFSKMEGTYVNTQYRNIKPYYRFPSNGIPPFGIIPEYTVFVYDKNTSLRLEYTNPDWFFSDRFFNGGMSSFDMYGAKPEKSVPPDDKVKSYKFIDCVFEHNNKFWDNFIHKFQFSTDFINNDKNNNVFCVVKQEINSSERQYASPIEMRSKFNSRSGIEIDNTGQEVILRRGEESIPLKKALQQYFSTSNTRENFVEQFTNCESISDSKEKYKFFIKNVEPLLRCLNSPMLSKEKFKILNESKILAVWCLVPNEIKIENEDEEKRIESQLIGLAEDKDGKLFHWATDLKEDISMLFPKKASLVDRMMKQAKVFYKQYMTRDLKRSDRIRRR